jgi:ABC-type nitrate/sulfonate/bicarbonate transport system substrate-binding protein
MTTKQATKLISDMKAARETISKMTPAQRNNLEKSWDIEHAYYSSTLEGTKLDRKEFDQIAKKIK